MLNMKASLLQHLAATCKLGKSSNRYLPGPVTTTNSKKSKVNPVLAKMNKLSRRADSFVNGVREHVRVGPKMSETVKGKLRLGSKILKVGGVEKVFIEMLSVKEGERLLNASQCYLSTTSGPIAGLLFISTHKVAFCSDRSIKVSSPTGTLTRIHYKVLIPLEKIKCVSKSENVKKPSQKYMEIVTVDDFDFWFMGFFNYQKALKYLQRALSSA
ncbi:GEM-like protein 6 [Prosopis cineraria]|uniref:GEM-like protein 6 n=1 Tax=Prosopis cineraria TaxID=364024 RepID=UPI0024102571|nr:GEM-like protein 6 [Prosopis cineraria]